MQKGRKSALMVIYANLGWNAAEAGIPDIQSTIISCVDYNEEFQLSSKVVMKIGDTFSKRGYNVTSRSGELQFLWKNLKL